MHTFKFIIWIIYLVVLLINIVICVYNKNRMDISLKIFSILIVCIFINELSAKLVKSLIGTKAPVSHIFSIIELSLTAIFFIYSLRIEKRVLWCIIAVILSTVLGLLNLIYLESFLEYNSNMLMIESITITTLALTAIYKIVIRDDIIKIHRNPNFLIWVIILILWTTTFFFWAFLPALKKEDFVYTILSAGQSVFILLIYIAFAVILFFTKAESNYDHTAQPG